MSDKYVKNNGFRGYFVFGTFEAYQMKSLKIK